MLEILVLKGFGSKDDTQEWLHPHMGAIHGSAHGCNAQAMDHGAIITPPSRRHYKPAIAALETLLSQQQQLWTISSVLAVDQPVPEPFHSAEEGTPALDLALAKTQAS